jgi:hypothetical protein
LPNAFRQALSDSRWRVAPPQGPDRSPTEAALGLDVAGRTLNAESAPDRSPLDAIDYVITHELCHVTEPHHGATFFELLAKVMPDWERRKQRLERAMA